MLINNQAMGLIFPNSFDAHVARMVKLRAMASLPFASRYRLVDFVLSSMSNCGIDNVYILPNRNYLSLMDHLGTGREWDLARKNGGVHIFPPFAESGNQVAPGRVGGLHNILRLLKVIEELLSVGKLIRCSHRIVRFIVCCTLISLAVSILIGPGCDGVYVYAVS